MIFYRHSIIHGCGVGLLTSAQCRSSEMLKMTLINFAFKCYTRAMNARDCVIRSAMPINHTLCIHAVL